MYINRAQLSQGCWFKNDNFSFLGIHYIGFFFFINTSIRSEHLRYNQTLPFKEMTFTLSKYILFPYSC